MAAFPFTDLHSFKDYVTYVQTYLPDRFPHREGVAAECQWNLERAFEGLRLGLNMARDEFGERQLFADCAVLVERALDSYLAKNWKAGFTELEEVRRLLRSVRTQ